MPLNTAITLVLALIDNLQRVSQLIGTALAAGRTELTADEWSGILSAADAARAALSPSAAPLAADPPAPEGV